MYRTRPYNDATVAAVLPSPSELLQALAGRNVRRAYSGRLLPQRGLDQDGAEFHRGRVVGERALCSLAHGLTDVHRQIQLHPDRVSQFDTRRAGLIADVDDWTFRNLPSPAVGARRHEHTLGEIIDCIAAAAARAFELLMADNPTGARMHTQWTRLAELELAYSDLVRDLRDGRCYLPVNGAPNPVPIPGQPTETHHCPQEPPSLATSSHSN
jgi:hypothetical protein